MENFSSLTKNNEDLSAYSPEEQNRRSGLSWWYRISSPVEPRSSASFEEKELFRRGRTGSQTLLALVVVQLSAYPAAFFGTNIILAVILTAGILGMILAMMLNRQGKVTTAGIISVIVIAAGPITNIMTTPGGLNPSVFPIFCILVLPLMCAASFLPPLWIFVVATINSVFSLLAITLLPHTAAFSAILKVAFAGVVTPIILSQLIVSVIAYIWVTGATEALHRADRAEEIARLEHDLSRFAEGAIQQKTLLEASIQQIVETHTRVANGDFHARVSLTHENVLWQISGSLNNLLARLQRSRQEEQELQRVKIALQQSREENSKLTRALALRTNSAQRSGEWTQS